MGPESIVSSIIVRVNHNKVDKQGARLNKEEGHWGVVIKSMIVNVRREASLNERILLEMGATHSFRVNDGIHFLPAVFSFLPISFLLPCVLYASSYMRRGYECCLLLIGNW